MLKNILHRLSSEWLLEHDQLVEHYADSPHICLAIIWISKANFWWHEIGCACNGHGLRIRVVKLARDTKITQLADTILRDENVLSLDVSMKDVLVVHGQDSHHDVS